MPFRKVKCIAKTIRDQIAASALPPGSKIPSLQALAGSFGTSPLTVRRVLSLLESEGLLVKGHDGAGYFVQSGSSVAGGTVALPKSKSAMVVEAMKQDILGGVWRERRYLPSKSDLARRYSCSPGPLREALSRLVKIGLLTQDARLVNISRDTTRHLVGPHLYLCGTQSVLRNPGLAAYRCIQGMEDALEDCGWRRMRFLLTDNPRELALPPVHEIAGFVLMSRSKGWWSVFRKHHDVPLAYVNITDSGLWPGGSPSRRLYHLLIDNYDAGVRVGTFLAQLGRTRVVYLNPYGPICDWAALRKRGLIEAVGPEPVAAGGAGCIVHESRTETREQAGDERQTYRRSYRLLRDTARKSALLSSIAVGEYLDGIYQLESAQALSETLSPLLDRAFRSKATAWVCANDLTASMALKYLHDRSVDVPGRISVVGLDNSSLAHSLELTSFDFGYEKLGRLAVGCFAKPTAFGRKAYVEQKVNGKIIVRATTGN